jgi:predicted RNase H-like nuclease (RuvC/YqgF family)
MESEKMKEIKKALECCSTLMDKNATSEEQDNACNNCPYQVNGRCSWVLDKDALELINELESENERLQNKNYQLEQDLGQCENGYKLELHTARYQLHSANEDLRKAEKRIAELEKEIEENAFYAKGYAQGIKNTYEVVIPDKLKQFAERLKKKAYPFPCAIGVEYAIPYCKVDETLKEFIK